MKVVGLVVIYHVSKFHDDRRRSTAAPPSPATARGGPSGHRRNNSLLRHEWFVDMNNFHVYGFSKLGCLEVVI